MGGSLGAFGVPSSDPSRALFASDASAIFFSDTDVDDELEFFSCCSCFLAFFFSNFSTFSKIVLRRSSSLSESRRASSMALSNATAPGDGARLTLRRPPSKSNGNTGIPPWLLDALRLFNSGCRLCPNGLKYRSFASESERTVNCVYL